MAKYVQWITHQGVRILHVNIQGLSEAEQITALDELREELLKERSGTPLLFDQAGTAMTRKTAEKSREVAAAVRAAGIPSGPSAVVGLNRIQKLVVQVFGQGARYFDGIDEAREWLVKEAGRSQKDDWQGGV